MAMRMVLSSLLPMRFKRGETGCILFIDDEESIVDFGKNMLESLGYEVVAKTSSMDALKTFGEEPERFDLVITDQTMPNLTGDSLAREILSIRPEVPIILCTGFSHTMDAEKAKEIGISEYLMKPYDVQKIATTIRRLLDKGDRNRL